MAALQDLAPEYCWLYVIGASTAGVSVPLFFEYEATVSALKLLKETKLTLRNLDDLLNIVAAWCAQTDIHLSSRPQLRDPKGGDGWTDFANLVRVASSASDPRPRRANAPLRKHGDRSKRWAQARRMTRAPE